VQAGNKRLTADRRFFVGWALLFLVGVLVLKFGEGAWPALGMLIVAPTILCLLLFGWGYLIYTAIKWCGGDPKGDTVGLWIFLSFAFLLLPLLVAFLERRR
jgi:hypothetical protein